MERHERMVLKERIRSVPVARDLVRGEAREWIGGRGGHERLDPPARTHDANTPSAEIPEIDVIHGMENVFPAIDRIERRKFRPARRAAALAPERKDDFPGVDFFLFAENLQRDPDRPCLQLERNHLDLVLDRQAGRCAHPQQVAGPIQARYLVQLLPRLRAELRFMPGAVGERRHAQVRPGQVLRRAQRIHARKRSPGPFAPVRRAIDAAQVAHALAQERESRGLAAHATANDEDVRTLHVLRDVRGSVPS